MISNAQMIQRAEDAANGALKIDVDMRTFQLVPIEPAL